MIKRKIRMITEIATLGTTIVTVQLLQLPMIIIRIVIITLTIW